jgi:hypothetical protein
MFIDGFLGFNEIRLAEFRINYLSEFIDHTIILESELTHSGISKQLFFTNYIQSQSRLNKNVEVIVVDLSQISDVWERERYSRRYLYDYIVKSYPNSKFILSDCDEIPSRDQMKVFLNTNSYMKFQTVTYFRRANFKVLGTRNENWNRGIFGLTSLPQIPDGGRFTKLPVVTSLSPGGHFSYLNYSYNHIADKLEAFGHQELNYEILKSSEFNKFCDKYSLNHVASARTSGFGLLKLIGVDEFTDIQNSLYEFEPQFFNVAHQHSNILFRILGSLVVSTILNDQRSRKAVFEFFVMRKGPHMIQPILAVLVESMKVTVFQLRRLIP